MNTFLWILAATFVDSLVGLVGVFSLFIKEKLMNKILGILVAFSAGALIGGAFFHLLSEALTKLSTTTVFIYAMIGFVAFLILESYLHWHHCEKCAKPYSYLMTIGDSLHNTLDGLVIAGTFMISVPLGIVATILIIAHEVPQELGIFAVLVSGGFSKKKAIFYSFLAQCTCILGGILSYLFFNKIELFSKLILPLAAGGFIYIAASDLVPQMHVEHKGKFKKSLISVMVFIIGILFMLALKLLFPNA